VMSVATETGAGAGGKFQAGTPKALFQGKLVPGIMWRNRYDVSGDGQRFLMLTPAAEKANPISVVMNWQALLNGK
jgi:hypothetical protein